jgi:hypothetical protein
VAAERRLRERALGDLGVVVDELGAGHDAHRDRAALVDVGHDDARAARSEALCNGLADALAGRRGDERDAARELLLPGASSGKSRIQ